MSSWFVAVRNKPLAALGIGVAVLLAAWVLWSLLVPHPDTLLESVRRRGYPTSPQELDAWYPSVPAAENAALVYTNAFGMLTNTEGPITNFIGKSWLPAIGQGLSAEERSELKAVLAEYQAAFRLLYSAPVSGRSRYPIDLKEGFNTLLPHLARTKTAVSLLTAEGLLHATEGDAAKATQAFLAAGRVAESLREEPIVISQLVRYADWAILVSRLERALSLTAFTDGQLASLQKLAEGAEQPSGMARAMAGEQAVGLSMFTDRKVMEAAFRQSQGQGGQPRNFLLTAAACLFRVSGIMGGDKAFFCDSMGKSITALELPYPARFAACGQLSAITNVPSRLHFLSRMFLPALAKVHIRETDHVALVRVAVAALAVERFRLAHGHALPENVEQLTPAWCQAVPTDPIDGKPLRFKPHGASYAVYSIGTDGRDDGAVDWEANYLKVPQDISFVVKH